MKDRERLRQRDDDGLVVALRARLDKHKRILRDMPVNDPDFVDTAHSAPYLRNRRPCKAFIHVEATLAISEYRAAVSLPRSHLRDAGQDRRARHARHGWWY